jgi:hypothetical protein
MLLTFFVSFIVTLAIGYVWVVLLTTTVIKSKVWVFTHDNGWSMLRYWEELDSAEMLGFEQGCDMVERVKAIMIC